MGVKFSHSLKQQKLISFLGKKDPLLENTFAQIPQVRRSIPDEFSANEEIGTRFFSIIFSIEKFEEKLLILTGSGSNGRQRFAGFLSSDSKFPLSKKRVK